MPKIRSVLALGCLCWVTGCGSASPEQVSADIDKVAEVKTGFGPEFQIRHIEQTGIDQRLLAGGALPSGLTFEPAECSKFAVSQQMSTGTQGNMAAVAAEGSGNRFIAIAMETSEPVPFVEPGRTCQKIAFSGEGLRGLVEVVEAPRIEGTRTLGVHRVIQAVEGDQLRTGEIYNYTAAFGPYRVLVVANPLVLPDQPVVPVDTARARDLLVEAVSAVRS